MSEHLIAQNGISNLRSVDEVHFQQASLESTFFRLVIFKSIQKEGSGLLDHVLRHKDIDNL